MNKSTRLFPNFALMNDLKEIVATLPVMESFYTLQGEGFHQGKAAYFIRLGGCDVGCVWCDVKESWDESKHPRKKLEILSVKLKQVPTLPGFTHRCCYWW